MIKTRGLTKKFNAFTAVENLDLDIPTGEIFGFLGPNGAGKTTTVRMLTSLIAPTSGEAWVNEFKLGQDNQEIRRNVGILTEAPGMYDRLSAWKNLTIYGRLYEVKDVEGQCEKYLRMLGLWERRHDAAGTFSKGMKQKLAIARAVIHEPSVLFLDEPTAGLDPEAAKLIRSFIEEISDQGRTIFLTTHNLEDADRLCDRIAVFKKQLRVVEAPRTLRQSLYGRQVVFHLQSEAEPFLRVVEGKTAVKKSQAIDNKLLLHMDDPEANNPHIIRQLVEAGAGVQFVGEIRHSLEDVYLQLVREEAE